MYINMYICILQNTEIGHKYTYVHIMYVYIHKYYSMYKYIYLILYRIRNRWYIETMANQQHQQPTQRITLPQRNLHYYLFVMRNACKYVSTV